MRAAESSATATTWVANQPFDRWKVKRLKNACLTWEYPLPILKTCPASLIVQIGLSFRFREKLSKNTARSIQPPL